MLGALCKKTPARLEASFEDWVEILSKHHCVICGVDSGPFLLSMDAMEIKMGFLSILE
jgi:hypothetical protein